MIEYLSGTLVERGPTHCVVECAGVGYYLHISLHTFDRLPVEGPVKVFVHQQIKEDAHTWYGFTEPKERQLFRLLIGVNGIGPALARTMLSSLGPDALVQAIASGDVARIQAIKGIGAKTAQRVLVDLRDKVIEAMDAHAEATPTGNTSREAALSALEVLGFARKLSEKVVDHVLAEDPAMGVEDIVKFALKNL